MADGGTAYTVHPTAKGLNLVAKERIDPRRVEAWLTLDDGSMLLEKVQRERLAICWKEEAVMDYIVVDTKTRLQPMLGIGGTIMDSDTWNLLRLKPDDRAAAIEALVSPSKGAGFNLMRIPFGSSDWNRDWDFYTYHDAPDPQLKSFSIERDRERGQIAIIKEFLAANPQIKLLASVWGLPAWMKLNNSIIHGVFNSDYMDVYADYLVKCIEAYEREGITIDFITSQNEPGTADDRATPATMWHWWQQRDITIALRDRLDRKKLSTRIWAFDHNFDMTQMYVKPALDDPRFKAAIDAVAFHDYRGRIEEMSVLKRQHPEKPFVLTEKARMSLKDYLRMIECFRNWSSGHISWTTISNDRGGPHQWSGGHERAARGWNPMRSGSILNVPEGEPARFIKTLRYYYHAHLSRFIERDAVCLCTNPMVSEQMNNVAFQNADGSIVVVAANDAEKGLDLALQIEAAAHLLHLPAKSMLTIRVSGQKAS